jgi:hypothetical protein
MSPDTPLTWRDMKIMVEASEAALRAEFDARIVTVQNMHFTRYADLEKKLDRIYEKMEGFITTIALFQGEKKYREWIFPTLVGFVQVGFLIWGRK